MKRILLLCLVAMFAYTASWAQRTVTGSVTGEDDGTPVPGVNVVVKGTSVGTVTDIDGIYQISVPDEGGILVFSFIGLTTEEVEIGSQSVIDMVMTADIKQLTEIVVTGVAVGTSTKKIGFDLAKVNQESLEKVPAVDPGNALRGKAAGITIVQPSGNPSVAAQIRLRGSTSISGNQSPLIIIDGIITDGSLSDINMEDVESMEVIKGAAASSLYGSLAGNGVIQIITKRGGDSRNKPTVTIRGEYGMSQLARDYPGANKHGYLLNDDGSFFIDEGTGQVVQDPDGLLDNPYPRYYDNAKNIFGSKPWYSGSVALSNSNENFNYYVAYQNLTQAGIVAELPDYKRNNFRANIDYMPNKKWKFKTSLNYTRTDGTNVDEQGQSPNIFYGVLIYDPYMNLGEKDENGQYVVSPDGFDILPTGNFRNPFYQVQNFRDIYEKDRLLGSFGATFEATDWLTLTADFSIDKTDREDQRFYPKGFETAIPNTAINNGNLSINNRSWLTEVLQTAATFNKQFGDLRTGLTLKYLYENREYKRLYGYSDNFFAKGVESLQNGRQTSYDILNVLEPEKAENFFINLDLDWKDKIIVNGLLRRDGSSLFGEDQRYQWYYRGSIAYRISEDLQINGIDEWKIRASYGTSGLRPYRWNSQYETFSVTDAGISPRQLGNKEIRPGVISELEVGTNITFLSRFNFIFTYADSKTEDDIQYVPLSPVTGYVGQYQNAGDLQSTAIEAAINGDILSPGSELQWNMGFNFTSIKQEITSLNFPAYTRNTATALNIFRVEPGLPYGTMFGNVLATSLDQLQLDDEGYVVNDKDYASNPTTIDNMIINEDGYVVRKDYYNTGNEQSMLVLDEEGGTPLVGKIGDTNPDFNIGWMNTLTFKGVTLYALVDWKQGGDIYNYTKQLLYFEDRHLDQVKYAEEGKHRNYSGGASVIYNAGQAVNHFVEDGSYVKIREISLSYTLRPKTGFLRDAVFSVSGRNLFTFTKYSGWDPEVAINNNPTNFLIDEFSYPNFRTFTGSVKFTF